MVKIYFKVTVIKYLRSSVRKYLKITVNLTNKLNTEKSKRIKIILQKSELI